MQNARLAALLCLTTFGCSNGNHDATPAFGAVRGVATLGGKMSGNAGILVAISGGSAAITDDAGNYVIADATPGAVTIQAQAVGYATAATDVTVVAGQTSMAAQLDLAPLPSAAATGSIAGHVLLFDSANGAGSTVTVVGAAASATTAADGSYALANLPVGAYDVTFAHAGYVSQTVHGALVNGGATTGIDDVTLRRDTTTINGHTFTRLIQSPDLSLALYRVDSTFQIVSLASGKATIVSDANLNTFEPTTAAFSADNRAFFVGTSSPSSGPGFLWLGATDGSPLRFVTSQWLQPLAFFSPDSSRFYYATGSAVSGIAIWMQPAGGGTATQLVQHATILRQAVDNRTVVVSAPSATTPDAVGNALVDVSIIDTNTGKVSTTPSVVKNSISSPSLTPMFFSTSTGTSANGLVPGFPTYKPGTVAVGDLYGWLPAQSSATKLSGGSGPASVDQWSVYNIEFNFVSGYKHLYLPVENLDADHTWSEWVLDIGTTSITPRRLLHNAHDRFIAPGGPPSGNGSSNDSVFTSLGNRVFRVDMNAIGGGVYAYDLDLIDLRTATLTTVKNNVSVVPFSVCGNNAAYATLTNANQTCSFLATNYTRAQIAPAFDETHYLYGFGRDATNTLSYGVWDGTSGHAINDAAAPIAATANIFRFSGNFAAVAIAGAGQPLVVSSVPAAGDGTVVQITGAPTITDPNALALSWDGSRIAYLASPGNSVWTFPTASGPQTPVNVFTDPNGISGTPLWIALSASGGYGVMGDGATVAAGSANTFAFTTGASPSSGAVGDLGNARPTVLPFSNDQRIVVASESSGNGSVFAVDASAPTAATALATSYSMYSASMNAAATRAFFTTTSPSMALNAIGSSGTTPVVVAGSFVNVTTLSYFTAGHPNLVDPAVTYFGTFGPLSTFAPLIAFDGGVGAPVTLAAKVGYTANILSTTTHPYIVIGEQLASSTAPFDVIISPRSAPAHTVFATQLTAASIQYSWPSAPSYAVANGFFESADGTTMYALVSGAGAPSVLSQLDLASGAVAPIASDVSACGWDQPHTHLLFGNPVDPATGSYSLRSLAVGSTTPVTIASGVIAYETTAAHGNIVGIRTQNGQILTFTAPSGGAAHDFVAADPYPQGMWSVAFSGDESSLVVIDGSGNAWGGSFGGAGTLLDTYVSGGPCLDMSGANALMVASHPTDVSSVLDHAALP